MINMSMRQKNIIHVARMNGKLLILELIHSLLHAAVNQQGLAANSQAMTAAGYLMIRSDKCQFHPIVSFLLVLLHSTIIRRGIQSYSIQRSISFFSRLIIFFSSLEI